MAVSIDRQLSTWFLSGVFFAANLLATIASSEVVPRLAPDSEGAIPSERSDSPTTISCEHVEGFRFRRITNARSLVEVRLLDDSWDGETLTVWVDGGPIETTVAGDRAQAEVPVDVDDPHAVSVLCYALATAPSTACLIEREHLISENALGAESVYGADLDGDGDVDPLSASYTDDKIAWYENTGGTPPVFVERIVSTNADGALDVFAIDLDGDTDVDVLSASVSDDMIAWYENDGGTPPFFQRRIISTNADWANTVSAADLDGDLDPDVLSASHDDDKVAWYESSGGSPPSFEERIITTDADGAIDLFTADLDGDLDVDVLSASGLDDTVAWYENLGGSRPDFREHLISTAADFALSVFAADLDGDLDADVLSASANDHKIAWYENDAGDDVGEIRFQLAENGHGVLGVTLRSDSSDGESLPIVVDGHRLEIAVEVDRARTGVPDAATGDHLILVPCYRLEIQR